MPKQLGVPMSLLACLVAAAVHAEGGTLRLHSLFTDNMVIQRDRPIRVWGQAEPGTPVAVSLGDRGGRTTGGADGKWAVVLEALPAGGPYELKITGDQSMVLRNVLVGDVWICAGQSNMAWSYGSIGYGIRAATGTRSAEAQAFDRELAATVHPKLRLFRIPVQGSPTPLEDFIAVEDNPWFPCLQWVPCVPRYAEHFSNVAYHFARALQEATGVPIGLIQTVAGGIPIHPYISRPTLEADPDFQLFLEADAQAFPPDMETVWQAERERWRTLRDQSAQAFYTDTGNAGEGQGWPAPEMDASEWREVELPGTWATAPKTRGAVWLRREVTIPEAWKGQPLGLDAGVGCDYQTVYFNGQKIGEEPWREPDFIGTLHHYPIPAEQVAPGRAAITLRLFDYGGGGSLSNPLMLTRGQERLSLAGVWRLRVERELDMSVLRPWTVGDSQRSAFRPAASFNAAIHPMKGFGFTGAIWYQGETDSTPQAADVYRQWQPAMVNDWRRVLDQPDLAFLAVQLSTWGTPPQQPENSSVALLRESQYSVLSMPRAGLVTAIDLGTGDVHPPNKREVGERLARLARSVVYGESLEAYGPMYDAAVVAGDRIRVRFRHLGGGLVARDGKPLRHFAIAGQDRQFVWAKAEIEGDTVVVWSDDVPEPKAVRYAWAANPEGLNLYSRHGLPVFPFRTDDWPLP